MSDLSIIIVNWNGRELLLECLASIERLAPEAAGLSIETWVVDNGSSDGSGAAVREAFPWVQLLELGANRGFSAGNNAALRRADGRYALLLNSDAQLQPGVLEGCVRVLDDHPEVGILGPALRGTDGRSQNAFHAQPSWTTELVPKGLRELLWPRHFPSREAVAHAGPGPVDVPAVLGAALFVRRALLEEVGLLPEDHFLFLEETDLCLRASRAGWRVVMLPSVCVTHVHGASSKQRLPAETRIEYQRSLVLFFRKHRGAAQASLLRLWRAAKALLYVLVRSPGVVAARGRERWRQDLRVLAWYLRGCPSDWGIPDRRPWPDGEPAPALDGVGPQELAAAPDGVSPQGGPAASAMYERAKQERRS